MRITTHILILLFFFFSSCGKPSLDACIDPDIDISEWKSYGDEHAETIWENHFPLKLPPRFQKVSYSSQHGGFLYKAGSSRFEIAIGLYDNQSVANQDVDSSISRCKVNINGQDILITTSKQGSKYYVSARQIAYDGWSHGHTYAFIGETFNKNTQKELLKVIHTIKYQPYKKVETQ